MLLIFIALSACDVNKDIGDDLLKTALVTYNKADNGKQVFSVDVNFKNRLSNDKYLYIKTKRILYAIKFDTGDSICFTRNSVEKNPYNSTKLISEEQLAFRLIKLPATGIKSFRLVYTDKTYVGSGKIRALKLVDKAEFNQFFNTNELLVKSKLPIISITTKTAVDEQNAKGAVAIFENNLQNIPVDDMKADFVGPIKLKMRGGSSKIFDKKSFKLELTNKKNRDVALLGMPAEHDWVLHGPYIDISLLRNKFAYNLADDLGLDAPKCKYCELVLNNEYQGVYLLTETIKRDKNRLKLKKFNSKTDSLTEYLLKIDRGEGILFRGLYKTAFDSGFDYYFVGVYPKEKSLSDKQISQIKSDIYNLEHAFLNDIESVDDIINIQSFVRYFILNELTKNIDSYRLSTFLYKKGRRFYMGPVWDYNFSLGLNTIEEGYSYEGWVYKNGVVPVWWDRLMENRLFKEALIAEWVRLRSGELSNAELFSRIDNIKAELDGAIERNFIRWDIYNDELGFRYSEARSYAHEIKMIKNWLNQRIVWMDEQLIAEQN